MSDIFTQGYEAESKGVKWYENPYPGGGISSYIWDQGHTAARLKRLDRDCKIEELRERRKQRGMSDPLNRLRAYAEGKTAITEKGDS